MSAGNEEQHSSRGSAARGLDCALSVNTVAENYPSTLHVFHRFGVDTCCGGTLSVAEAAQANAVDATALCAALREATFV